MNWKLSFAPKRVLNVLTAMVSLGLLIALAFSLNALFASRSPQVTSQPQPPSPQPLSTSSPINTNPNNSTAGSKMYRNEEHGFESNGRIRGIDVSEHQGTIDWSQVYDDGGYRFAFARASLGDENPPTLIDGEFETNMENGHAAGMLMGAYHFAYPDYGTEAASEARHFLNVAQNYLRDGYLRPMLDLECGGEEAEQCSNQIILNEGRTLRLGT